MNRGASAGVGTGHGVADLRSAAVSPTTTPAGWRTRGRRSPGPSAPPTRRSAPRAIPALHAASEELVVRALGGAPVPRRVDGVGAARRPARTRAEDAADESPAVLHPALRLHEPEDHGQQHEAVRRAAQHRGQVHAEVVDLEDGVLCEGEDDDAEERGEGAAHHGGAHGGHGVAHLAHVVPGGHVVGGGDVREVLHGEADGHHEVDDGDAVHVHVGEAHDADEVDLVHREDEEHGQAQQHVAQEQAHHHEDHHDGAEEEGARLTDEDGVLLVEDVVLREGEDRHPRARRKGLAERAHVEHGLHEGVRGLQRLVEAHHRGALHEAFVVEGDVV
mmetsp:Transcript_12615/g.37066  ORF Transcript_12615/g.37066 Transcript_12615/m.37066 type:complete len:332 (-) Transcript_12615:703-1698(-)